MLLEIADICIKGGLEREFETAMAKAIQVLKRASGFRSMELRKVVEQPDRYRLLVHWESLEDHTVGFQGSELFKEWRGLLGPFFARTPVVDHSVLVAEA